MPTYEYRCADCGHTFDAVQAFTDDALTECPECGGRLKKVFGNVGIAFKGSGFYRNDSRSGSKSTSPSASSPANSSDSSSTSDSSGGSDASSKSDGAKSSESSSNGGDTKTSATSASAPAAD